MSSALTIYDIKCTVFITSHALYMTSHLLCMMSHSLCVLHHPMTLSVTSNPICLWHIHFIWHHTQCYDHTIIVCLHSHYACDNTQCIFDFTHNVPLYEKKSMYVITAYICMTPYALHMTSPPHFMASHHFIYDVKSTISNITFTLSDLTSTVSTSTHPLSQWYHSHPMYDITYSIHVTSYPLYLWHHIHYVRQHNTVCCWYHTRHMCDIICTRDDITSTLSHQTSVYDVISTKGMTSHPLY